MADTSFNDPAETAGFDMSDAYRRASQIKPVKAKDLRKVYKPYGSDLKVGQAKGKSDSRLYRRATQEVLEWYKQKKQAPKPKRRRASGGGGRAARSGGGSQAVRSSGSAGTRRSTGGLPDTAMPAPGSGRRVTSAAKLPDIPDPVRTRVNLYTGKLIDPRLLES